MVSILRSKPVAQQIFCSQNSVSFHRLQLRSHLCSAESLENAQHRDRRTTVSPKLRISHLPVVISFDFKGLSKYPGDCSRDGSHTRPLILHPYEANTTHKVHGQSQTQQQSLQTPTERYHPPSEAVLSVQEVVQSHILHSRPLISYAPQLRIC